MADSMVTYTLKHDKPVTDMKFNQDGDLLFSSDKSGQISVWWAHNGEHIGMYTSPKTITTFDVNESSTKLVSGGGELVRVWDVESGECIMQWVPQVHVRSVKFSNGSDQVAFVTDHAMGTRPEISIYNIKDHPADQKREQRPVQRIDSKLDCKVFNLLWSHDNENIFTCNADGTLRVFNVESGHETNCIQIHNDEIRFMRYTKYNAAIITASKDGTCHLIDPKTLEIVKTYSPNKPLNSAALSPLMNHVIMGGGESSEVVTTTARSSSEFKVFFYNSVMEDEALGFITGHIGPIHVVDFSPNGKQFASGSEDGFVRLHILPEAYLNKTEDLAHY
eukprot:TRINITY_DN10835_c0_g1_i1.p1 TRINITY_DN10835_c0_g1~~TRINITY_DN10835_c0_g1_i1.p1  ORF type:complete len:334 (+),score=75.04 TRINITY_DN10835_c0_g1_i1:57-1058(+)